MGEAKGFDRKAGVRRSTRALLDAFASQGGAQSAAGHRHPTASLPRRRVMGVRSALEWAFGTEKADLDFDDASGWVVGTDSVWRLMRQKALGCQIDGGGRSGSHPDAEVIASFVAALPEEHGGRVMAAQIATLARAGLAPDPIADPVVRCVPAMVGASNQYGCRAKSEDVPAAEVGRWPLARLPGRPARASQWCRVAYTPTAQQIGAARRNWLAWYGALLHLGHDLRMHARLEMIELSHEMPQLAPWNKRD